MLPPCSTGHPRARRRRERSGARVVVKVADPQVAAQRLGEHLGQPVGFLREWEGVDESVGLLEVMVENLGRMGRGGTVHRMPVHGLGQG